MPGLRALSRSASDLLSAGPLLRLPHLPLWGMLVECLKQLLRTTLGSEALAGGPSHVAGREGRRRGGAARADVGGLGSYLGLGEGDGDEGEEGEQDGQEQEGAARAVVPWATLAGDPLKTSTFVRGE